MAKLVAVLLVVAILAGVVFFLGWVQFRIQPDTYGVLVTKTGGVHPEVLRAGQFQWHLEAVLPTNATVYRFPDLLHTTDAALSGELPSAQTYAGVLPERADFSYEITFAISFRVRPERLPSLVDTAGLRPEALEQWLEQKAGEVAQRALESARSFAGAGEPLDAMSDLSARVQAAFEELEIREVRVASSRFPDMALYELARRQYQELAFLRARLEQGSLTRAFEERERQETTFQALERYGDLITRYPSLLQLFYLNAVAEVGPIELPPLPTINLAPETSP